jgi:hypothetical protein
VILAGEAVHGDGDVGGIARVTDLAPSVAVRVAVLRPVLRCAAEDAQEQRHTELDRTAHRLGTAAGAEPDPQRLFRPRNDERLLQRSAPVRAAPGDVLGGVGGEQQLELRGVEHVVVAIVEVEEREGDGRGAAAGDGLDPAGGDGGGGRELLEHAQRLVGGEHGDGGAELDPSGRGRGRGDQ